MSSPAMTSLLMNHDQDRTVPRVRLLGLSGSLRPLSYSTAILRELQAELEGEIQLDVCVPRLPLYNEDETDPEALAEVEAFRAIVAQADGLIICTPEYNHGMPGVLKNALDSVSRPSGNSVFRDKPVLVITNSPAFTGGVRAQTQVNETMLAVHAFIVPGKQIVIGGVREKMRDGRFLDKTHLSFALAAVRRLASFCQADNPAQALWRMTEPENATPRVVPPAAS